MREVFPLLRHARVKWSTDSVDYSATVEKCKKAIGATPPALMLAPDRSTKLFCGQILCNWRFRPDTFYNPPPALLVIRGFSVLLIGWWGWRLPISSERRPAFECDFWQLNLRWTIKTLTGALTCFVSWGWREKKTIVIQLSFVYCEVTRSLFDLQSGNLLINDVCEHEERDSNSEWSLHRLQRYTTWPRVCSAREISLDVSWSRQNR